MPTAIPEGLQGRGGSAEEHDFTLGSILVPIFLWRGRLAPVDELCPG